MGIYEKFSSDTELEKRGIVLDFGNGEWVRIARMGGGNKKFVQLFESLMKPYRRAFELGTMDDDKAAEIMHEAFAKAIVLEWNITGKDGKPIEFNVENCKQLFEELPEFFATIKAEAENRANFNRKAQEEESGNS